MRNKLASRFKLRASRKSEVLQKDACVAARSSQHHTGTSIFLSRIIGKKNWSLATTERGFTLIELLVVTGILVLISGLVLANNTRFGGAILLKNLAYDVGLSIREVQVYGT